MADSTEAANPLHEARALLRTFAQTKHTVLRLRSDNLQLFLSRDPALRARDVPAAAVAAVAKVTEELTAPHLGTLAALAPLGSRVEQGAEVARLMVLDRETVLRAASAGTVIAHHHAVGALVEYGQPVLTLAS